MTKTKVSVIKLKEGNFKLEEIECEAGYDVTVQSEGSNEIMFDVFDDTKAIILDGIYFNHRQKSLRSSKGITQSFKVRIKELN